VDPGIAVQGGRSIDSLLVDMTAQRRLNMLLLTVFGVTAALLAAVGIYGVIAYSVEQRAKELSVRVALGASTGRILKLVMAEGLAMSLAGLVAGLAAALALGRWMTSLLYGVTPADPATFGAISVVAIFVALAASLVPALRAVRTDPVQALKQS
jgi:ABC-type antimicrobial peptide transport system permease subunit